MNFENQSLSPIECAAGISGWRVTLVNGRDVRSTVIVLAGELPVPTMPTTHQIFHVAKTKLMPPAPPKPLRTRKPARVDWKRTHEACQATANRHSLDVDQLVSLLPDALATLTHEWQTIELARRTARHLTGLSARDCARIEDAYRDHSTIEHFDEAAQSVCLEHPELNWEYGADNGHKLWALLSEPDQRKPTRLGAATIERAAELATIRYRGELEFSEWTDDDTFKNTQDAHSDLADVPF